MENEDDNIYIYEQETNEINKEEDQVYIIDDENNGIQNYQEFPLDDNVIQLMEGDQCIYYDQSGQAFIVDPSQLNLIDNTAPQPPSNGHITYSCPSCTQVYQNANAFTKHTREKHFIKVFTCRQCDQFFENLSQLFLHARRSHSDPRKPSKDPASYKFHCPDCNYMTNNGGTMEHHKRAHSGVKPYLCDICNKSFAQKANMKTHKNRHIHKERVFHCEICSKSFNSHDIYLAHLRTREHELQEHFQVTSSTKVQIRCMGCNKEFGSYYDIKRHSQTCLILKNMTKKFWCVFCSMHFPSLMMLKHHLKSHRSQQAITCPVCGEKNFPGFNQLNHHITRAHSLKVNRRNVCRYCESTFETKEMLQGHIEEMHLLEKNGRQSRGAAGRLRCDHDDCDFTSNSVMLMDRHHEQHNTNTLPVSTVSRRRRKAAGMQTVLERRRRRVPPLKVEEVAEIEHLHGDMEDNEVLRLGGGDNYYYYNGNDDDDDGDLEDNGYIKSELVDGGNSNSGIDCEMNINGNCIDDMDIDDLEKLASIYVEKPTSTEVKRKRGRPRKCLSAVTVKNENVENSLVNDNNIIDINNNNVYNDNNMTNEVVYS